MDKKLVYFDNASTSFPKAPILQESFCNFLDNAGINASRGVYSLALESGRILHRCRFLLSQLVSTEPKRILFHLNATHAINVALQGFLKRGDIVVTTQMEHNAIKRTLNALKEKIGIKIREITTDEFGNISLQSAKELCKGARMLACVHVNNVNGATIPLEELSQIAKDENLCFLLDASQSVGVLPVDNILKKVDLIAFSGHKGLLSTMGVGVLGLSKEFDEDLLEPLIFGGTGSLSEEEYQPRFLPDKFESGTINMHGITNLKDSLEWIYSYGIYNIYNHKANLKEYLYEKLQTINNINIYSTQGTSGANLSFVIKNKSISDVGFLLSDTYNICTRIGLHCSPATHKCLDTLKYGGTIRVSIGAFNTKDEIDYLIYAIKEIEAK